MILVALVIFALVIVVGALTTGAGFELTVEYALLYSLCGYVGGRAYGVEGVLLGLVAGFLILQRRAA